MATHPTKDAREQLRTLFAAGTAAGLTDAQLLERVAAATDAARAAEAAFEALVARHGPMILGVCRRALDDPRDVEDAFQATFLVLVRKAGSVRVDDSLGRWLYGVARRVAKRARYVALRRRAREAGSARPAGEPTMPPPDAERAELLAALDDELGRLPEKLRAPMVLCYLEGLTHPEAAMRLRWPVGTVKGRLAQGRTLLRTRLTRRGLAPSVAPLGAALEAEARPAVPPALAESTARAAMRLAMGGPAAAAAVSATVAALAKGTLDAMLMFKLKAAAIGLLATLILASTAAELAQANLGDEPGASAGTQAGRGPAQAARDGGGPGSTAQDPMDSEGEPVFSKVTTETEVLFVVRDGTRVRKGELICSLDPAELDEQRAWQVMATRRLRAAYENARKTREAAEMALAQFEDGPYKEHERLLIKGEIALAEAGRKRAEDRLEWSNGMFKKGFVSTAQNIADQVALKQATFEHEKATTKAKVFEKFTIPRKTRDLQGEIDKARARELELERIWELGRKGLASTEEQIRNCRIYAPVSGRLVYARWRPPGSGGGFTKVALGRTVRWRQLLFWIIPEEPAPGATKPAGPDSRPDRE